MTLASIGAEVHPRLTHGVAEIAAAVVLADPEKEARLTSSVSPLFASRPLVWRLDRFFADHREIQVRVDASTVLRDTGIEYVGVWIHVGVRPWDETASEWLVPRSECFLSTHRPLTARLMRPADLALIPII